jgi:hypothetical protein
MSRPLTLTDIFENVHTIVCFGENGEEEIIHLRPEPELDLLAELRKLRDSE